MAVFRAITEIKIACVNKKNRGERCLQQSIVPVARGSDGYSLQLAQTLLFCRGTQDRR